MRTSTDTTDVVKTFSQQEVDALVEEAIRQKNTTPIHIHRCTQNLHEWVCNSPYCEDVAAVPRTCVLHGGTAPIAKGLEPWRGR